MTRAMTGGCQCGRIRYRAEVEPDKAYLCHCRMCQRATGGVSIAFVNAPQSAVRWETEPDWYASSPIAHRPFCSQCGTPLGFAFLDGDNIDLTVGSFDDPAPFRPSQNYATESMLTAWTDVRHLPGMTSAENAGVMDRWKAAGLEPPE
ncbi:GFA family protein [Novosphingobium resinovorum]|uniref:Aldehyde-activating protein n=1 Tax=Novosphingobium resinovorum TaxID=158500 RepID=A0A1D8A0M2_9SPHN|nr:MULTISPECIES: GFA family protein [Novosphingobium]AOR75622.1 aldehyde-activating protein [Novosphingobium resinovorum]MBF7010949.1 GFA family protein [Novosphingobium sp. HR1a]WJM28944.1 GFA family protein [Novosphingobium resinovorum]